MKLSVVIPVFNESDFISDVLFRVQNVGLKNIDKEIIVIDDFSIDGTREFLEELAQLKKMPGANASKICADRQLDVTKIKVIFHEKNRGKGAALQSGFKQSTGDVIVIQDADLELDPNDYSKLLEPIEKGAADVVYGSRFLCNNKKSFYFWHYAANKFLTSLSNVLTGLKLSDMECCYKMFTREVINHLEMRENRFGFEPEFTAKVAKLGYRIFEVPISYHSRTYEEGRKIRWRDGIRAIYCIIKYNLTR